MIWSFEMKPGDRVFWFERSAHVIVKHTGVIVQLSGPFARVRLDEPAAEQVQAFAVKRLYPLVDEHDV